MSASKLKGLFISIVAIALVASFGIACDKSGEASSGGDEAAAEAAGGGATATDIDNGGITEVPTDPALIAEGKDLFAAKTCTACHKMDQKIVGPPLRGVTERREAAWIAQMILHPEEMVKKDPEAKKLLKEYGTPMTNAGVTPEEAKAIIAYLGSET